MPDGEKEQIQESTTKERAEHQKMSLRDGISKARALTLCDGSEKVSWGRKAPGHVSWAWRKRRERVPGEKE